MAKAPAGTIEAHFSEIPDPRIHRTKKHKLIDILIIAICGVICGADNWVEIEIFGNSKQDWLKTFLELPNGIPSHDTFGRVFARIDPVAFQKSFKEWVAAVIELTKGQVIALDGKQLIRSHDESLGKNAIYMVSAWATENQLVLGQVKVDEKSNEITAIPKLLKLLDVSGCIVVTDAIGTQTNIARTIINQDGDYILSVKENQGNLYEDIQDLFADEEKYQFEGTPHSYAKAVNKDHGRIEIRQCWVISNPEYFVGIRNWERWKGLKSVAMIISERQIGDKAEKSTRFFISSLDCDAKHFLQAKRSYWGIENQLHWVLDIAFREDDSRVRKGNAPQNLALIRHMALNMLKQEKTAKGGVKAKRLQAALSTDYLLKVLSIGE
jgi:predicted transposase YbfD/YdcC